VSSRSASFQSSYVTEDDLQNPAQWHASAKETREKGRGGWVLPKSESAWLPIAFEYNRLAEVVERASAKSRAQVPLREQSRQSLLERMRTPTPQAVHDIANS
jgi:hypothetical protein